ncbi:MAG: sigma-70 family RNA polymerase sigma factor [Planctomycetes bacterium]|nr:sigma-70 family RNA polymerase sigma factor [Planctomycetota bacterium]
MTDPLAFPDFDTLRRQEARLRPMVRALVDADAAGDVLQETWVRAWRRPPRSAEGADGWLRRVALRVALSHRRTERRRRSREAEVGQHTAAATPSTAETVERLAVQRAVAAAVSELAEPYRTAVLLRYYHGLAADDVATATGTTPANVRQRTRRGLDRMRDRLTRELGRDWRAAPAIAWFVRPETAADPLPTPPPVGAAAALPVLLMTQARIVLVVGGLCLLAATALFAPQWFADAAPAADDGPGPVHAAVDPSPTASGAAVPPPVERAVVAEALPPVAPPAPDRGVVLDPYGRSVAGVEVGRVLEDGSRWHSETVSDAAGEFTAFAVGPFERLAAAPPWAALAVQMPQPDREQVMPLLIVAPCREQQLTVRDDQGLPIAGARVAVRVHGLVEFPRSLDDAREIRVPATTTDAAGRAHFAALPVADTALSVSHPGHRPVAVPIVATTAASLDVVLPRIAKGARIVTGVVTGPRGEYVRGAAVGLGSRRTRADDFGNFELVLEPGAGVNPGAALWATGDGLFPVSIANFGEIVAALAEGSVTQDLHIERRAQTIVGRVLDADGKPVANVALYPWQLATLTNNETAEDLAAPPTDEPLSLVGNPVRAFAHTDAEGRFELGGLDQRPYRLRLYHAAEQWGWTTPEVPGGARDVELRLPAGLIGPVAGEVRDRAGAPVAGLRVGAWLEVYANGGGVASVGLKVRAKTDADGRFTLPRLARDGVALSFAGGDWVDRSVPLGAAADPTQLRVTMLRRCHVRVQLADPALADGHVSFLDAAGETQFIHQERAGTSMSTTSQQLHDGKTEVLFVSEDAVTLQVQPRKGGAPVQFAIVLRAGEVNLIAR